MNIYDEIKAERAVQREKWGDAHDDKHHGRDAREWARLFQERLVQATVDFQARRRHYVVLAALTVAAIEAYDRAAPQATPSKRADGGAKT